MGFGDVLAELAEEREGMAAEVSTEMEVEMGAITGSRTRVIWIGTGWF